MQETIKEVVIVSAVRTPVGRAFKGSLAHTRPEDLAALVLQEAVVRVSISSDLVEDIYLGCAMPEAEQGLNVARLAALHAGFPDSVSGVTINRFCASGLQAVAMAAAAIAAGQAEVVLAGGVESMSLIPMGGHHPKPHPELLNKRPEAYMSMGLTAEKIAKRYGISREEQDRFALSSHQKAAVAWERGHFEEECVAVPLSQATFFQKDELIRPILDPEAALKKMANLSPSFLENGTVTAGNSSPLSDGAAALLLMSAERAAELEITPLARFLGFAVGGVAPEVMGVGPVVAVPKVLARAGLSLADIDLIELNEAFAAQALAVIRELNLDDSRVNVNGGAIALGHPLGCSGAKILVTLIHELQRRGGGRGLATLCVGGGMGVAGIIEIA